MKINVESYSITGLTQEEFDLICTAMCHFPTNHPKSREVFGLLDKFASAAAVMSKEDKDGTPKHEIEGLEESEKPYEWLKLGMMYYVPMPAASDLYNAITYTADDWDKRVVERGIVFQVKEEAIECAKKMLAVVKQED